ncbi:hypothetical protein BaRGS_00002312, partial [Batillaria attramentaria]
MPVSDSYPPCREPQIESTCPSGRDLTLTSVTLTESSGSPVGGAVSACSLDTERSTVCTIVVDTPCVRRIQ